MKTPGQAEHAEIGRALTSLHCEANPAMVERTRRAVRERALAMREQRLRQRRSAGIVLIALFGVLVLSAPAIWGSVDGLLSGEPLSGLPVQIGLLVLLMAPAMLAALIALWKGQHGVRPQRRGF